MGGHPVDLRVSVLPTMFGESVVMRVLDRSVVSLDLNNGRPNRSDRDTNWHLLGDGEGGKAPDWVPGSRQHRWLREALETARREAAFTFVMFHHCPYSSGPHARPPGEWPEGDDLSGVPLRELTPLFMEYGVDVLLTGHDEMLEHSVVDGEQLLAEIEQMRPEMERRARRMREVPEVDEALEGLPLVPGVSPNRLHQVRDQVIAS